MPSRGIPRIPHQQVVHCLISPDWVRGMASLMVVFKAKTSIRCASVACKGGLGHVEPPQARDMRVGMH